MEQMTKELSTTSYEELARIGLAYLPIAVRSAGPQGIRRFLHRHDSKQEYAAGVCSGHPTIL
jgi:hypothetical protein